MIFEVKMDSEICIRLREVFYLSVSHLLPHSLITLLFHWPLNGYGKSIGPRNTKEGEEVCRFCTRAEDSSCTSRKRESDW